TKGRGIAIHRADCINMMSLPESEKERFIEVAWDNTDSGMTFDAPINIVAEDRKGLVADVSKICEDMDINISGVTMKKDKAGIATMEITLALTSTRDIQKVLARFNQIKGVVDVYRTN
ncbi:MAG: bifunctional (p)ppGpp synthetase/guanosine-3',5'-bis(diphosphate) 3'-pyrophosphohydrolase, partial [Firmicutes bacterium]|nr:bifunctional (p)ppGpp synthetase/guanosine-3',5'-bis(diphosphate) 3'-pyrophosphohydrolase [Bacillota bacterium]